MSTAAAFAGTIVHELVHARQWASGSTLESWAREEEAFAAGNAAAFRFERENSAK